MDVGSRKFFEVAGQVADPKSLETLSGEILEDDRTPMIERAVEAWKTPLPELTCDQVRLLVSQQMGLRWLASPLIAFVLKYPDASTTFYPGDLTQVALRSFAELLTIDPAGARAIAQLDLSPLINQPDNDPSIGAEVQALAEAARRLARGHS